MAFSFSDELCRGASNLGLEIGIEPIQLLEHYFHELKKWNAVHNLVAKSTTDQQLVENHFLDSLTLIPSLGSGDVQLLDIGTGAGFPGLVCGVVKDNLRLTLVEPRLKKVSFLRHIVRTLGMKGVDIRSKRIEDLREKIFADSSTPRIITCRALTGLAEFLKLIEPFAADGVEAIVMKGPRWEAEMASASEVLSHSPFALRKVEHLKLSHDGAQRVLLFFSLHNIRHQVSGDKEKV
jgi:16S rRNA (guanine527-N7)-methyltransferase